MAPNRALRPKSNGSIKTSFATPTKDSNHQEQQKIENGVHDDEEEQEEDDTPHTPASIPTIAHRFRHNKSILVLIVTGDTVYAGTQGGELLVYSLPTYERVRAVQAHNGSVLGLCLSQDRKKLFSSAGDRFVNLWDTKTLTRLASIYSVYDVGDVFCVSYSSRLETLYLGAQNTSIQWYDLTDYDSRPAPDPNSHPSLRRDRFFDSSGPGGVRTPRRGSADQRGTDVHAGYNLEIGAENIHQFAHYGYVYCTLLARGAVAGIPAEEILISGGGDGVIKLWNIDGEGGRISEIGSLDDGGDGGESVLTLLLEDTFLYSGRVEGEINVWDLETRQLLRTIKAHTEDVLTLSMGPGVLFSAFVDGTIMTFDQRHEHLGTWKAHEGRVLASGFTQSKTKAIYVTGGNDDTVAVWNVTNCYGAHTGPRRTSHEEMIDSLKAFISYRSVSSNRKYEADCRRAASYIRSIFKKFGAATEMLGTEDGCNPVVYAHFRGHSTSSKPKTRILFYGHYDVISAENFRLKWNSDPFTLVGKDGYLYGRGVSDNKGPIIAAVYAVAELVMQHRLESDIVFLIEGEEEQGSRGFRRTIQRHKDLIGSIDWILLANSYWLDDEVPCLTYGLRGVLRVTIEVQSEEPDLHSGVDGSRLLDEPMKDLVMLTASLTGPHGRVRIPGFYDSILPVSKEEEELYGEIAATLLERSPELGNAEELIASLMGRWRDPSLTIHAFKTSGPQNTTIIPRMAQTKLSMRLVPNQEVEKIHASMVKYLNAEFTKLESKNTLHITVDHQAEPWLGDYNNAIFQTLEQAVMEVWSRTADLSSSSHRRSSFARSPSSASGSTKPPVSALTDRRPSASGSKPAATTSSTLVNSSVPPLTTPIAEPQNPMSPDSPASPVSPPVLVDPPRPRKPLYIREGGTIPAARFLEKVFNAPAAHLPCGQASDNAHLDNERFRVLNLYNSKEIFKRVFERLPGRPA